MLRNALVAVSLLLVGGVVVALVNAQEFVRRSTDSSQPGARLATRLQALRDGQSPSERNVEASPPTPLEEPGSFPLADEGTPARPLGAEPRDNRTIGTGTASAFEGAGQVMQRPPGTIQSVLKRPSRDEAAPTGGFEPVGEADTSSRRGSNLNDGFTDSGIDNAPSFGNPSSAAPQLAAPGSPDLLPPPTSDQTRTVNQHSPSDLAPRSIATQPESGPATALLGGESPSIRVETLGPAAIILGKQATYTVRIVNQSDRPAEGVEVLVAVPRSVVLAGSEATNGRVDAQPGQAAGQLVWTIDQVGPRGNAQLQIKLLSQSPRPFTLGVEWTLRPQVAQAEVLVQEPKLDLSISGAKDVLFGETKVYTLVLSNPGTGDAENVSVSLGETANSSATKQLGTLAAGERRELDIELTAREAGTMQIQALALADGDLRSEAVVSVRVRRARLEVQVAGPPRRFAGSSASYEVRIKNVGDAIAEDVVAAVAMPEGAKFVGGIATASAEAHRVQWAVGMLNPGSEKQFQLQFDLTLPGDNRIDARVLAAGDLTATAAAVTRVEALADLKLLVNDPRGPKSVGEEVVYEVLVMNRGTKSARNIEVLAQFSEGIEPVRAEGAAADVVPGQVLFKPIAEIAPGDRVVLKVTARAAKEGNHVFRAEVNCGDPETRLVTEETTRFFAAGVLGP